MTPVLIDTSAYIAALRQGQYAILSLRRWTAGASVWLSAVVLEELYAGATPKALSSVGRLERDSNTADRILVPNISDWTQAGVVLAQLGRQYGYEQIGRGRLTNDALIAMSAARCGYTTLTLNARDFSRLVEFRPFRYQLAAAFAAS